MNYAESIAWLTEQASFGIKPGLERIRELLARLDNPEQAYKTIHIAGTNGKGSVTAMLTEVLRQAGLRVGRYTSPHLLEYTERIAVDVQDISPEDFAAGMTRVRTAAEEMVRDGMEMPTEFELLTACAFLTYRETGCEYAVIEAGLGGTLDSTNVITPVLAVITNVSLDHQQYMGDTPEEIAAHKAGIIKHGVPVVTAAQGAALRIIREKAEAEEAKLYRWEREFKITKRTTGRIGQILQMERRDLPEAMLFVPFFGIHQAVNAAVAAMAATVLGKQDPRVGEDALREGIARAKWPGRFEVVPGDVPVILDGAHNGDGAKALALALQDLYPRAKRYYVFTALQDKHVEDMVQELIRPEDTAIIVPAPTERTRRPEEIAALLHSPTETATDVVAGLRRARELAAANEEESIVIVCGSLYIIGPARAELGL